MNRRLIQMGFGCLLSAAIGAAVAGLRTRTAPSSPAENAILSPQAKPPGEASSPRPERVGFDAAVAALKTILGEQKGASRWATLFAEIERAKAEDMPGILQAVGKDSAAVRMLGARWAELNPRHMFNYLYSEAPIPADSPAALPLRGELQDALMEEWVKSDITGAREALSVTEDFPGRESFRMSFVNRAMNTDVEQSLLAMRDWKVNHYGPDLEKVDQWAAANPRRAAEIVASLNGGYAAAEALKHVARVWGEQDPQAALQYAAGLNGDARIAVAVETIGAWAGKDLAAAVTFASAQDDPTFRGALGRGLLKVWADTDPAAALAWSEQNLQGAGRADAIVALIEVVSKKDLAAVADLVAGLNSGAAQNRAAAAVFATWFEKGNEGRESAFEWLRQVEDPEARKTAMERVQWNWNWKEPDSARAFISGPYASLATDSFVQQVARTQAARDPQAAMQWASTLDADRAATARNMVLQNWLQARPEGAMHYVRALPPGPEREESVRSVTQTLVFQNPTQAAAWYRGLSPSEQQMAREIFNRTPLSPEQRALLQSGLEGAK